MIGSCTSCLYTSIEIHWTAPSSSSCYFQRMERSLTPLSVHFQMSQHWSCNRCPCWKKEKQVKYFISRSWGWWLPEGGALRSVRGGGAAAEHVATVVDHVHVAHQQPLRDVRLLEHRVARRVDRLPVRRPALLLHWRLLCQGHVVALGEWWVRFWFEIVVSLPGKQTRLLKRCSK